MAEVIKEFQRVLEIAKHNVHLAEERVLNELEDRRIARTEVGTEIFLEQNLKALHEEVIFSLKPLQTLQPNPLEWEELRQLCRHFCEDQIYLWSTFCIKTWHQSETTIALIIKELKAKLYMDINLFIDGEKSLALQEKRGVDWSIILKICLIGVAAGITGYLLPKIIAYVLS